jgi:hypothetical protein
MSGAAINGKKAVDTASVQRLPVVIQDCVNTASEVDLLAVTIPANSMADGDYIEVRGIFRAKKTGSPTLAGRYYIGSESINITGENLSTDEAFTIQNFYLFRLGTSLYLMVYYSGTAPFPLMAGMRGDFSTDLDAIYNGLGKEFATMDFTSAITLKFGWTFGTANANNYIKPISARALLYS